jgi:RimJ/RimL family protein N-acetyltransferase
MATTFDFNQNLILENETVLMRPLQFTDVENLLEFSINEPEIWKYSLADVSGRVNLENYVQLALQAKEDKIAFPFVIFDKRTNAYAGSTRFYDIQLANKTLLLGYTWYGVAFQGTGLNKQCKYLMLEYTFEVLGIERVEFRADSNNLRSIAAMKRIGCTQEGLLRSHMPLTKGSLIRRDSVVLSILKDEWFDSVKENLKAQLE